MALDTQDHQAVTAATKTRRNAVARDRRARLVAKRAGNAVYELALPNGEPGVFVLSADEPSRCYVLTLDRETQRWRCSCLAARWSKERTCRHEMAANAGAQEGQE